MPVAVFVCSAYSTVIEKRVKKFKERLVKSIA